MIEGLGSDVVFPPLVSAHPVARVKENGRVRRRRGDVEAQGTTLHTNVLVPSPREELKRIGEENEDTEGSRRMRKWKEDS